MVGIDARYEVAVIINTGLLFQTHATHNNNNQLDRKTQSSDKFY